MGGETMPREAESGTQLHTAFKKLKVDPEWNPSQIQGNVESLRDVWTRAGSQPAAAEEACQNHDRCKKKTATRVEPYPQDFLCSMAEKLTFNSEVCHKQSCTCSELKVKTKKRFNYASSSVPHRPLIREARLKFHHSEKDTKQVLRAARLRIFKHGKHLDSKTCFQHTFGCQSSLKSPVLSSVPEFPLFGAKSKQNAPGFQSLAKRDSSGSKLSTVFTDKGQETDSNDSNGVVKNAIVKRSRDVSGTSEASAAGNRSSYSDCGKQMRDSSGAKLEDTSVEELAGYFEDYVHIPKKMSSMAEMMYA